MNKEFKEHKVFRSIFVGAVLILIYWALNNIDALSVYIKGFFGIFMPFITGGVIAFIFNVPMCKIEKHLFTKDKYQTKRFAGIRRVLAYILTVILFITVISLALLVIIPQVTKTVTEIVVMMPTTFNRIYVWALDKASAFPEIQKQIASININWGSFVQTAISLITNSTKGIITGSIGAVTGIISGFTSFFIGFVFSVYLLFQKETLGRQIRKILYAMLSKEKADRVLEIQRITNTTFSNFLSGQCIEAVILGTMFVVVMSILRMPYALLVGVVIAITALIPVIGAFIGCMISVILIALVSPLQAIVFVAVFFILQQIEGNLIYPHVVGNSVGLPGIWVLVAVTVGGNLFGIAGMLTFIPICAVIYALTRVYINNRLKKKNIDNVYD